MAHLIRWGQGLVNTRSSSIRNTPINIAQYGIYLLYLISRYYTEVDIQAFLGLSSSHDMHNACTTLPCLIQSFRHCNYLVHAFGPQR